MQPSSYTYATVAQYGDKSFVKGYTAKENIKKISNSAAVIRSAGGEGQAVLFADDPTYRGYWPGTNRIFLNSIFFAAYLTHSFGGLAGGEE